MCWNKRCWVDDRMWLMGCWLTLVKTRYVSRFIICDICFFLMLILGYCGHDRLMWTNLVNPRINHPLFHQKGVGIKHDTSRVYYWVYPITAAMFAAGYRSGRLGKCGEDAG